MAKKSRVPFEQWLLPIALLSPLPATAANWPQTFHDAGHTGFNPAETTLSPANVAGLQFLWGNSAVGGAANFALDQGTLYVEGGTNNSQLAAIDAATGSTLWSVANGDGSVTATSGIAFGENLVFAGCGLTDPGGRGYGTICAYRRESGRLVWKYSAGCNCAPEVFVSPLVYSGGALYFGYYSGGPYGTGHFAAADAKTGATIWTYDTGDTSGVGVGTPGAGGGYVYFACRLNNDNFQGLCAFSQTNGSFAWSQGLGEAVGSTVHNGRVYVNVTAQSEVVALDGASGAQVWSTNYTSSSSGAFDSPPAIAKDVLYLFGSDSSANTDIYALHAGSGKAMWAGPTQNVANAVPSVANGVVYVDGGARRQDGQPAVVAYDAKSGALLWSGPARDSTALNPPPIIANGTLYLTNAPCGSVCAYGLSGGTAKPNAATGVRAR